MHFHIANGTQAVKPTVGGLLHRLGKPQLLYPALQGFAWLKFRPGECLLANQCNIAPQFNGCYALGGYAVTGRLFGNGGNKGITRFGGVAFDVGGIAIGLPLNMDGTEQEVTQRAKKALLPQFAPVDWHARPRR